jgi:hypothetical protein
MTKLVCSLSFVCLLALSACGSESPDSGDDGTADGNSAALTGMPCDVKPIVDKYCGSCHGETPTGGAPMSLVKASDFQGKASNGSWMHLRTQQKLHDPAAPMPPVSRPQPTPTELLLLERWVQGGAQTSNAASCLPEDGGVANLLPPASTVPDSECEMIVELRTHELPGLTDTTPYQVAGSQEHYECFYYPVTWPSKMHILKIEPLIDNAKVLHHFLLYQESEQVAENGSHQRCNGTHPTASLLTGWAPGGFGVSLPPDVGLQTAFGGTTQFNMEVHYNNTTGAEVQGDRSGVRICATTKLRKNEAAAHWLGTEVILSAPGREVETGSTCTPKETAHILSVSPHMHKIGKHMRTDITRADGSVEVLTDRPFDFNDQQVYPVGGAAGEVIVGPGDKLKTTCTFKNDTDKLVTYGSLTSQEMCYNFVVAWPAGALDTGGSLVEGANRCMQ